MCLNNEIEKLRCLQLWFMNKKVIHILQMRFIFCSVRVSVTTNSNKEQTLLRNESFNKELHIYLNCKYETIVEIKLYFSFCS